MNDNTKGTAVNETVSIVGGAIAGTAAAYYLARAGYQVTVYEQLMPSELISQQILGIDPHVWKIARSDGLNPDSYSVPHVYHIYGTKTTVQSPYFFAPWLGWHQMLVDAGQAAGVTFRYGQHMHLNEVQADHVIDATGIAGAARDRMPFTYSGRMIYRGRSPRAIGGEFTVFQDSVTAFTGGDDKNGHTNWQLYATRPQPPQMRTVPADMPPEAHRLPPRLRRIVLDSPGIVMTPLSFWTERPKMMQDNGVLVLGDGLGPIAPATTAGAALAYLDGRSAPVLLAGGPTAAEAERKCMERRQFVLNLGVKLSRPEIGGNHEDPNFVTNEGMIYGGL